MGRNEATLPPLGGDHKDLIPEGETIQGVSLSLIVRIARNRKNSA